MKLKRLTSKDEQKKAKKDKEIQQAVQEYLSEAECQIDRIEVTMRDLLDFAEDNLQQFLEIEQYVAHARRQIDQIRRRVIEGETIPHVEKVFSIFEPHTEWISKGKAGVPQELGLPVCIMEDQHGFILNHRVMQQEKDVDIAVSFTQDTLDKFPDLTSCSYDKGFWSPGNQVELSKILKNVVLPRKGRVSAAAAAHESSEDFRSKRRQHSAVESAINALENHGLDRCPDHGIDGFKRYVALAVTARNLHQLGNILLKRERKRQGRIKAA